MLRRHVFVDESEVQNIMDNYNNNSFRKNYLLKTKNIKKMLGELRSSVDVKNTNKRPNNEGESGPSKKMKTDSGVYLGESVYKDNVLCYKFHDIAEANHNTCKGSKGHTRNEGHIVSSFIANIENIKKTLATGDSPLDSENANRLVEDYQKLLKLHDFSKKELEKSLLTVIEKKVCSLHNEQFQSLKNKLNIKNGDENLKQLSIDSLSEDKLIEFVNGSQKNVEELFAEIEKGVEGMLRNWALNINEKKN